MCRVFKRWAARLKYAGGRRLRKVKANSRPKIAQPTTSCWSILHLAALPFRPLHGLLLVLGSIHDLSRPKLGRHSPNLAWPSHHQLHASNPTALQSPGHTVAASQTSWGKAYNQVSNELVSLRTRGKFQVGAQPPKFGRAAGSSKIRLPYSTYTSLNHGQVWGKFLTMRMDRKLFENRF